MADLAAIARRVASKPIKADDDERAAPNVVIQLDLSGLLAAAMRGHGTNAPTS